MKCEWTITFIEYKGVYSDIDNWIFINNNLYEKEVKKVNKIPYFELKVVKVKGEEKEEKGFAMYCKYHHNNCEYQRVEPYVLVKEHPKGNWVNGENLDAIKFPCFCSYIVFITGEKKYGELNKNWDDLAYKNIYELSPLKQCDDLSVYYTDTSLKKLMINLKIKIKKGRIIIYEEEK